MKQSINRTIYLFTFILLMPLYFFSQEKEINTMRWGIEYDLMAPRIGQWYSFNMNGWIGFGRIKHSLVFANINVNQKHLTDESFEKDHLTAFGYRGEIFSHKELKRWSTGVLLLYSINNVVTSIHQQSGRFSTLMIGLPMGYTWVL